MSLVSLARCCDCWDILWIMSHNGRPTKKMFCSKLLKILVCRVPHFFIKQVQRSIPRWLKNPDSLTPRTAMISHECVDLSGCQSLGIKCLRPIKEERLYPDEKTKNTSLLVKSPFSPLAPLFLMVNMVNQPTSYAAHRTWYAHFFGGHQIMLLLVGSINRKKTSYGWCFLPKNWLYIVPSQNIFCLSKIGYHCHESKSTVQSPFLLLPKPFRDLGIVPHCQKHPSHQIPI